MKLKDRRGDLTGSRDEAEVMGDGRVVDQGVCNHCVYEKGSLSVPR